MKPFEWAYLCAMPFLPALHRKVRKKLIGLARESPSALEILDVGGRRSHYTIGVPAAVTITDLPKQSDLQKELNLGLDNETISRTLGRRSNIAGIIIDDMTRSSLSSGSYDVVVAVEVLEHVEHDGLFVSEVRRVLRAGGSFIMTTPNGDFRKNTSPDHKRHYQRDQLESLLAGQFEEVQVVYAVKAGPSRSLGLRSWSWRRPFQTAVTMAGNVASALQSMSPHLDRQPLGTSNLIAIATKR
jgi:SAM-dependent methyltransferase